MPTVSIITPAFNAAPFIGETSASVLSQDFQDWEWIVVDDGSEDETAAEVAGIADERIKLLSQKNLGVSAARNLALDRAMGDYVTFLDADDRLTPQSLSLRVGFLEKNPDVGIVNGRIRKFTEDGAFDEYQPALETCRFFERIAQLEEAVFFGPFYMIRRTCIGEHRFPRGLSHCEDLIFFTELAHDRDFLYGSVDDCVYEYRVHQGSAMSNLAGIECGYFEYLKHALPLDQMTLRMRWYLRLRVASILGKSWLRRGQAVRALSSATRSLIA